MRIPDITAEDRWPDYTALVIDRGFRSVLGVPLNAFGQTIGVINIYRDTAGEWTDEDLASAQILAAMGAGYIVNANQLKAQHTLAEQLHAAIDSRDLIGQAKGIVMAQSGVASDEASQILRQRSQAENRKLRELAQELVEQQGHADNADRAGTTSSAGS